MKKFSVVFEGVPGCREVTIKKIDGPLFSELPDRIINVEYNFYHIETTSNISPPRRVLVKRYPQGICEIVFAEGNEYSKESFACKVADFEDFLSYYNKTIDEKNKQKEEKLHIDRDK